MMDVLKAGKILRNAMEMRAKTLDKKPGESLAVSACLWMVEEWDKAVAELSEEEHRRSRDNCLEGR